jgi:hypothetical protein
MSNEWDIKSRGDHCAKTEKPFADGERYVSRLTFSEEGYVREDYAESVWDEELAEGALSVWRSTFQLPPPPPEEPLKKETAETLLRQFMAKEDYSRKNVIYILAVMLERRRVLVERDVQDQEDGTQLRMYEHRKTGEMFVVPDPKLKLRELEHVQVEVLELLGGKRPGTKREESSKEEAAAPVPEA